MFYVARAPTLAYLDSFIGLVPCKVLSVEDRAVTLKITATRGPYKRGEVLTRYANSVVPRPAVWRRKHQYAIRPYKWEGTPEGCHSCDTVISNNPQPPGE
jgi:hypothetical protein